MKLKSALVLFAGVFMTSSVAFAGADDASWIAKCMMDNAKENVAPEVMSKYCTCMNAKMDENETLSITAWEQKHPAEMAACEKESGWK
ncbi:MAG: hypothetical protein HQL76_04320 [Magnetococcales bacterium]|nr:hypothetical protein [Magnetococcales bacterium]